MIHETASSQERYSIASNQTGFGSCGIGVPDHFAKPMLPATYALSIRLAISHRMSQ